MNFFTSAARIISTLASILLIGCASRTPPAKVAEIEQRHLSFIRDGATSREQALLQLGMPTGAYEGERIMTWRLVYNGEQISPLAARRSTEDPRYTVWPGPAYNLVLVFDARNLVQRHSFIEVR